MIPANPPWLSNGRIPSLDGWRAAAVLMVVAAHNKEPLTAHVPWMWFLFEGELGVTIFFVLSGFLITTLLLRERERTGNVSIPRFYARRALRIIPATAFYLLVLVVLQASNVLSLSRADWIQSCTYTVGLFGGAHWEIMHFWSLSVEEHFYLFWPLIFVFFSPKISRLAIICLLVFALFARFFAQHYLVRQIDLRFWTPTRIDAIAYGCALAFLCRSSHFHAAFDRLKPFAPAIMLALVLVMYQARRVSWIGLPLQFTIDGVAIMLCIYLSVRFDRSWPARILNWRPLAAIGVLSYSIYIWQEPFSIHSRLPGWAHAWPQNLLLIAAASTLSYFLVERPFLKLKSRFDSSHAAARVSVPSVEQMPFEITANI